MKVTSMTPKDLGKIENIVMDQFIICHVFHITLTLRPSLDTQIKIKPDIICPKL